MTIEAFAPAKINLTLHVTGQRADGYHLLDSLVVFADVGDRLWLTSGPRTSIEVSGSFATGVPTDSRNIVWRAADLAGWSGHIRIEKNLPHGAGIGGGSSDAAAMLRAVGYTGDSAELGADVPVCMAGQAARMSGIGDQVSLLAGFAPCHAVLTNPGAHVPTPDVFAALTQKTNPGMTEDVPTQDLAGWLARQRNDLEGAACQVAPEIRTTLAELSRLEGQQLSRMSGSGATCFALFASAEAAAAQARVLKAAHPGWWVVAATLS